MGDQTWKKKLKNCTTPSVAENFLQVFEKSVIFNNFPAIAHSISAREGGNTVCWKAMV